jgi:hypothetical protein
VVIRIVAIHGGGFRNRKFIKILLYLIAFSPVFFNFC